jgi:hypothetical protein
MFAGAADIVPDSKEDELPRESPTINIPREPSPPTDQPRTSDFLPDSIPFEDEDFDALKAKPIETTCDLQGASKHEEDPAVAHVKRKQSQLAAIHNERLGHFSFHRLKLLAKAGIIAKELANVDPPTCLGCAYGKAHRRPWRHKGSKSRKHLKVATTAGQVVSIDQLVSPTPGFFPTHHGTPAVKRYIGATVFTNHFSDFTYVHLMTEMNAEATAKAKLAFERVAASYSATVHHYHADNDLFETKVLKASVSMQEKQ